MIDSTGGPMEGGPADSVRKAWKPGDHQGRVTKRGTMWRIGSLAAAKDVLLARNETIQAGFTAEYIPRTVFRNHPILISDGPGHDEQRRKVARFFAPKVVAARYTNLMTAVVDKIIDQTKRTGTITIDDIALYYTVEVTASIVGLTHAKVPALARRLVKFFRQPPLHRTKPRLGRTNRHWMTAADTGLVPTMCLLASLVLPAVRSRTKKIGRASCRER